MKKFLISIFVLASALLAMSVVFTLSYESLRKDLDDTRAELDQTQEELDSLTISNNFYDYLLDAALFESTVVFPELGDTVTGTVDAWGYATFIFYFEEDTTLTIQLNDVAPDGGWDLELYDLASVVNLDEFQTYEEVVDGNQFAYAFQAGYAVVMFNSYTSLAYDYEVVFS